MGEDSAEFDFAKQKIISWVYFSGVLGVVLFILDVGWIDNSTGFGKAFIDVVSSVSDSPEVKFVYLLSWELCFVHFEFELVNMGFMFGCLQKLNLSLS